MTRKQYRRVRYLAYHARKGRVRSKNFKRLYKAEYRMTFGMCYKDVMGKELHLVYERPSVFRLVWRPKQCVLGYVVK